MNRIAPIDPMYLSSDEKNAVHLGMVPSHKKTETYKKAQQYFDTVCKAIGLIAVVDANASSMKFNEDKYCYEFTVAYSVQKESFAAQGQKMDDAVNESVDSFASILSWVEQKLKPIFNEAVEHGEKLFSGIEEKVEKIIKDVTTAYNEFVEKQKQKETTT